MTITRSTCALIVAASFAIATIGLHAQSAPPRVQLSNLVYQDAFHVPSGIHSGGQANAGFEYGGTALGFNPARTSLFMAGHDWDQFVAEISIPALGATATLLQPLVDATEGKLGSINPGDPNSKKIGGTLPSRNTLMVSAFSYYDGSDSQVLSHFVRPVALSTKGQVIGPLHVGALGAGFYSGSMGLIPSESRRRGSRPGRCVWRGDRKRDHRVTGAVRESCCRRSAPQGDRNHRDRQVPGGRRLSNRLGRRRQTARSGRRCGR